MRVAIYARASTKKKDEVNQLLQLDYIDKMSEQEAAVRTNADGSEPKRAPGSEFPGGYAGAPGPQTLMTCGDKRRYP